MLKRLFSITNPDRVTMTDGEPPLQERFLELVLFKADQTGISATPVFRM